MSDQKLHRLKTARSLNRAQYDAMCIRAGLISRGLPTTSLPGHVVFTDGDSDGQLAFAQLSSTGDTYGGFGLIKTSRRTWQVLRRSGLPVPDSQAFPPSKAGRAASYAKSVGYQVGVSSLTGTPRRNAHDKDSFQQAFTEVAARVEGHVLVHTRVPGDQIRLLGHGKHVLAAKALGEDTALTPEDLDPTLQQMAVNAVAAIPGIETAAVTISTPQLRDLAPDAQVLVERVTRSVHLRDFARGSRTAAIRIADRIIETRAQNLGINLPAPTRQQAVSLQFHGVADPPRFSGHFSDMAAALRNTTMTREPELSADGMQLQMHAPALNIALLITRGISGFGQDTAHLIHSTPM